MLDLEVNWVLGYGNYDGSYGLMRDDEILNFFQNRIFHSAKQHTFLVRNTLTLIYILLF